jgi:hypothetical protein
MRFGVRKRVNYGRSGTVVNNGSIGERAEQTLNSNAKEEQDTRSAIITFHVRALSVVEAKATNRRVLRHFPVGRRLESSLQYRSYSTCSCDPTAPEGTHPPDFDYGLGLGSSLGAGRLCRCKDHQRTVRDSRHETCVSRSDQIPQVPDPSRRVLRVGKNGQP